MYCLRENQIDRGRQRQLLGVHDVSVDFSEFMWVEKGVFSG